MHYKAFLGYLGAISMLCVHFFALLNKPAFALSTPQHTTIHLEIVAAFTGTLTTTGGSSLLINSTYRTTGINHLLELQGALSGTYFMSGALTTFHQGNINPGNLITLPISLSSGDGLKNIFVVYTATYGPNSGSLLSIPLQFGIDTTPPQVPTFLQGPKKSISITKPLEFNRNSGIDAGVGIDLYSIQISSNPSFPSAMEFIPTNNSLTLAERSLDRGVWYWRLKMVDTLGNVQFSTVDSFTVTIGGGEGSTLSNNTNAAPQGDQCPEQDSSGNFFDGLCSPVDKLPELIAVPTEHQAAEDQSRIAQIRDHLHKTPLPVYTFPNYPTPKQITLYEDTPFTEITEAKNPFVNDAGETGTQDESDSEIYVPRSDNLGEESAIYQAKPGVKPIGYVRASGGAIEVTIYEDDTYQNNDYLREWYGLQLESCIHWYGFCPVEPVCSENHALCLMFSDMICLDIR